MIGSLLVANRGEIALRVMRTCRRLGIRTIGVYSDADARAAHVAEADVAYRLGPAPAADSYLNQAVLLDAARISGADAVHPGYGFLAENPAFAQAVLHAGLIWVGPPPRAMRALGDKAQAKALAEAHGVPVLSGYHGDDQSADVLRREADRIGYPLIVKATAGGGGRGMRVVESGAEFEDALQAAQREALSSFGDQRVLLERYLRRPRHIEIQILGDANGHLIHLGERECSIQRRHQKLIEESPSPALDAALRASMGDAALRLARAAGYANAGTVEFLLDEDGQFAFLEVNARLQVEHPVTELVTGLDLVELQLRVAAGESLAVSQGDITLSGHAIEVRVIAEDPLAGFLPSTGIITHVEFPSTVRVDTWIGSGTHVSPYYDSLLAKVIAHADDRAAATSTLCDALQAIWIDGVADNLDLLLAAIQEPAFQAGELHTRFLDEYRVIEHLGELPVAVLGALASRDCLSPAHPGDPWRAPSAWRPGRQDLPVSWTRGGKLHTGRASAELGQDGMHVQVDGMAVRARLLDGAAEQRAAPVRVSVDGGAATVRGGSDRCSVDWQGRSYRVQRQPALSVDDTARDLGRGGATGRLTAPMPGRVVKLAVSTGQRVAQNQALVVLEAMKMEHVVQAPHAGVVAEMCVDVGDQVSSGTQLLILSVPSDAEAAPVE